MGFSKPRFCAGNSLAPILVHPRGVMPRKNQKRLSSGENMDILDIIITMDKFYSNNESVEEKCYSNLALYQI